MFYWFVSGSNTTPVSIGDRRSQPGKSPFAATSVFSFSFFQLFLSISVPLSGAHELFSSLSHVGLPVNPIRFIFSQYSLRIMTSVTQLGRSGRMRCVASWEAWRPASACTHTTWRSRGTRSTGAADLSSTSSGCSLLDIVLSRKSLI